MAKAPHRTPLSVCEEWLPRCAQLLDLHRRLLDDINVFPVADSDTGTNCWLTVAAGVQELRNAPAGAPALKVATRAMLMTAKGNSGTILASYLHAFIGSYIENGSLVSATEAAAKAAARAVTEPVGGTIITVAQTVAQSARRVDRMPVDTAFETIWLDARLAVQRTSNELPALRGTGCVDSGAAALLIVIEALGLSLGRPEHMLPDFGTPPAGGLTGPADADDYDAEVLATLPVAPDALDDVREDLEHIAASIVIAGDTRTTRVHAHTNDPDAVAELLRSVGGDDIDVTVEPLVTDQSAGASQSEEQREVEAVSHSQGRGSPDGARASGSHATKEQATREQGCDAGQAVTSSQGNTEKGARS